MNNQAQETRISSACHCHLTFFGWVAFLDCQFNLAISEDVGFSTDTELDDWDTIDQLNRYSR